MLLVTLSVLLFLMLQKRLLLKGDTMKKRFISAGPSWSSGPLTITRQGIELDTETDAELIELINKTNVGGCVIEVPTQEKLDNSLIELAMTKIPIKVEPVSLVDIAEEKQAAVDLYAEREAERIAEEVEMEMARKAKEDATPKVIKDFKAKSPKVQAKEKAKKERKANG